MTDDATAVSAYDAGYVPCPDMAAAEPGTGDDGEAAVGYDAGYVAVGDAAAAEPSTADNGLAVAGFDAGYVANPCGETCCVADTFMRPDAAVWGTASGGAVWSSDGAESIVSNQGVLSPPNDGGNVGATLSTALPWPFSGGWNVVSFGLGITDLTGGCTFNGGTIFGSWDYTTANGSIPGQLSVTLSDGTNFVNATTVIGTYSAPFPINVAATATGLAVTIEGQTVTALVANASPSPIAALTSAADPQIGTAGSGTTTVVDDLLLCGPCGPLVCPITDTFMRPDESLSGTLGTASNGYIWVNSFSTHHQGIVSDQGFFDLFVGNAYTSRANLPGTGPTAPLAGSIDFFGWTGGLTLPVVEWSLLTSDSGGSGSVGGAYNLNSGTFSIAIGDSQGNVATASIGASGPDSLGILSLTITATDASWTYNGQTVTVPFSTGSPNPVLPPLSVNDFTFDALSNSDTGRLTFGNLSICTSP